jgi:lysophospholipase L1-like esterase
MNTLLLLAQLIAVLPGAAAPETSTVPNEAVQPAFVDIWQDIFLGRPTMQSNGSFNDNVARQKLVCPGGSCSGQTGTICMSNYSGSFDPLKVGDVFYIGRIGVDGDPYGNAPAGLRSKTHVIFAVNGPCASGTSYGVYPFIDYSVEPHNAGVEISPVWRHEYHPTDGAAYLIGYKLASDSRDTWGSHGPNLIRNGGFQADAAGKIDGWTTTVGTLDAWSWDYGSTTSPPSLSSSCLSGEGTGVKDCAFVNGAATDVVQAAPVDVRPGERYILSTLYMGELGCDAYGLADDRDGDGTFTLSADMKLTVTESFAKTTTAGVPRWVSNVVTIPTGVTAVKFLFHTCSDKPLNWIDYVAMRKQSVATPTGTDYLLADPGAKSIVLMGDSWLDPINPYGAYTKKGILDGFAARKISLSPDQVVVAGHGGDPTSEILAALPGVLRAHKPMYVILDGGINDIVRAPAGTSKTAALAVIENLKQMARLSMEAGAIPILLSMPPIATIAESRTPPAWSRFGPTSSFFIAHEIREGLRKWVMDGEAATKSATPPKKAPAGTPPRR